MRTLPGQPRSVCSSAQPSVRGSVIADDRTRAVRAGLQVAALAFGLLALARPELGEKRAELARQGRDVLLALD